MEEWDPANNDFVLRCNSCWRTNNKHVKIIRTSRHLIHCKLCYFLQLVFVRLLTSTDVILLDSKDSYLLEPFMYKGSAMNGIARQNYFT